MCLIAVQSYVKISREVVDEEQVYKKEKRKIYLYQDRMVTKYHKFPIQEILDLSFRKLGDEGGLLYLHTTRGIYSYNVYTSPEPFIQAFKRHIQKEYF